MTSYLLIDAKTRAPVPLPYHTQDDAGTPCTVHQFHSPTFGCRYGQIWVSTSLGTGWHPPQSLHLAIVTEDDFMAEQDA